MITMNRKQLLAIFRYLKVPCDTYDLGTSMRIEACYDVEYTEQGWEMCRFDRGKKYSVKIFDNETDACFALLNHVMHMRGLSVRLSLSIHQLHSILVYLKVPKDLYDFSAGYFGTNCYSMEWTAQGWEVFFAVNGEKCDVAVFDSETDACLDLLYKGMHR